ncbi:hypothetical protein KCP73_19505 [Salmonella enterica subsp. enterica]|nr:hypothetical protein KCP73_19505 [Salmonella enterica subsp. enterica]
MIEKLRMFFIEINYYALRTVDQTFRGRCCRYCFSDCAFYATTLRRGGNVRQCKESGEHREEPYCFRQQNTATQERKRMLIGTATQLAAGVPLGETLLARFD